MYKSTINAITNLLKVLGGIKPYTLTLILIGTSLFIYKSDISHVLNVRLLNKDRIVSSIDNDLLISTSLNELMNETNADRAYIFRFHNGVQYYDGSHKNKMSCDYEVVRVGVAKQASRLQDIPVSLYPDFIIKVISKKMFYKDVDIIEDIVLKSELKSQGIEAIAVAPFYRDGKLVAMIGIDYITPQKDKDTIYDTYPEEEINSFIKRTNRIGQLLK